MDDPSTLILATTAADAGDGGSVRLWLDGAKSLVDLEDGRLSGYPVNFIIPGLGDVMTISPLGFIVINGCLSADVRAGQTIAAMLAHHGGTPHKGHAFNVSSGAGRKAVGTGGEDGRSGDIHFESDDTRIVFRYDGATLVNGEKVDARAMVEAIERWVLGGDV